VIIYVDFDHTLADTDHPLPGYKMGPPMKGAFEALSSLRRKGHEVVIFTVRGGTYEGIKSIRDWMHYFKIPYDSITNVKGNFDILVDDRAIFHTSWEQTLREMTERLESKNGKQHKI